MASTETTLLKKVGDILSSQGLASEQAANELALLVIWAHHFDAEHMRKSKDHPYLLAQDYQELKYELGKVGAVFEHSRLYDTCNGAAIAEIVALLASLEKNPSLAAKALIDIFSKLRAGSHEGLVTMGLGQLLAGLVQAQGKEVALLYPTAISVAPVLPNPDGAVFRTHQYTPLNVALATLLGIRAELDPYLFEEEPSQCKSESHQLPEAMIVVPPFGFRPKANMPMYGMDTLVSEEIAVLKAIETTKGRGVVLIPKGVLFRHTSGFIRQLLIKNNWLEAVVSLPGGTLSSTAIPVSVLVIDKNRAENDPVVFFDTADIGNLEEQHESISNMVNSRKPAQHGVLSSCNAIRDNDYDLSFNRYKLGPATAQLGRMENTVALDTLAVIIRAQSIKAEGEEGDPLLEVFHEAAVRDITESGQLGMPEKQITVGTKLQRRAENQRLQAGDILLAVKGSVGRVAFVGDDCEPDWIAGQAFLIIRPKSNHVSTSYLYRYLSSELIKAYLNEMSTGSAMTILKAADVTEIPVPLPQADELARIEQVHGTIMAEYQAIQEHRKRLVQLEQQCWPMA